MRNLKKQTTKNFLKNIRSLSIYFHFPKIKSNFIKVIFVLLLMFVNISGTTSSSGNSDILEITNINIIKKSPEDIYIESFKTRFKIKLIEEVQAYITKMAPGSKLTPEYLVSKCLEYNTDIVFVLSQALLESHFGTKGKAVVTNSIWNVGTYDNGTILYRYKIPDESLEPYLNLLKDKYLINITTKGDTIYKNLRHLVEDRGYINYRGKRFARDRKSTRLNSSHTDISRMPSSA